MDLTTIRDTSNRSRMPRTFSPKYNDILDLRLHKPILVIGKGPTYKKRFDLSMDEYTTIGLNNVDGCDYNHIIDWNCMDFTRKKIICPYYPILDGHPYQTLAPARPNMFFYNFYTAKVKHSESPIITNDCFSIHCVMEILHLHGIRKFSSVGVDGGGGYGSSFAGTPNPRVGGYDGQEVGIQYRLAKYDMEMTRL